MLRLSNVDEGKPQNIFLKLLKKPTLSALLIFASLLGTIKQKKTWFLFYSDSDKYRTSFVHCVNTKI